MLARNIDGTNVSGASQDPADYIVGWADFMKAVDNHDVVPAFGNKPDDDLERYFLHDVIHYGDSFDTCWGVVSRLLNQVRVQVSLSLSLSECLSLTPVVCTHSPYPPPSP